MKFRFYTEKINKRLYKRFVQIYVYQTFGHINYQLLKGWKFEFFPSEMAVNDPHFHGEKGVGGVTGMGHVKLYIEDKKTTDNDVFLRVFRRNALMISHETCHAMLIVMGKTQKVKLRNDDYSGHRSGMLLNYSTAEVHDRHIEKKFYVLNFDFWDWWRFKNRKMIANVLDFRNDAGSNDGLDKFT